MKTKAYVTILMLGAILLLATYFKVNADTGDFYLGSVCASNPTGVACTTSEYNVVKVPGKHDAPELMNHIPAVLQPKLKIVPAPTPVFN